MQRKCACCLARINLKWFTVRDIHRYLHIHTNFWNSGYEKLPEYAQNNWHESKNPHIFPNIALSFRVLSYQPKICQQILVPKILDTVPEIISCQNSHNFLDIIMLFFLLLYIFRIPAQNLPTNVPIFLKFSILFLKFYILFQKLYLSRISHNFLDIGMLNLHIY